MSAIELPLVWVKHSDTRWCRLFSLNFELIDMRGVYVIWHGGYPARVVRVGHGDIAHELRSAMQDPAILAYLGEGPLFVTWAAADASCAAGIHRYLADRLRPLIEDPAVSSVVARAANSPF